MVGFEGLVGSEMHQLLHSMLVNAVVGNGSMCGIVSTGITFFCSLRLLR